MTSSGTALEDAGEPPPTSDHLGKLGAEQLAQRIQRYWTGMGHDQVRVWVEPASPGAWSIRSNLLRGLPPAAAASCG